MKTAIALPVVSALLAFASPSLAQTRPAHAPATTPTAEPAARPSAQPAAQPQPEAAPEYTVQTIRGQRVYVLRESGPIYGDIQRPFAFAVTGRAPLGYTALEATPTFLSAVNEAVRRDPF